MPLTNVLAVVTVADFDATRVRCERLLGRPADRLPMPGRAEWQITDPEGKRITFAEEPSSRPLSGRV